MKEQLKELGIKTDYKPGDIVEIINQDTATIRGTSLVGQRFYVNRLAEDGVRLAMQTGRGEITDFYYEFTGIILFKEKP